MYSRGDFESLHSQPPVDDILTDVTTDFRRSLKTAMDQGVSEQHIALDIGLGFGKTFEQNLELLAKLDKIVNEFQSYPLLVGSSRKSFIGNILGEAPTSKRLGGSLAMAIFAILNGARIVRVHDVRETVDAVKVVCAIQEKSVKREE